MLVLVGFGMGVGPPASAKIVNRIVAIVNEEILTQGELEQLLREEIQLLRVSQKLSYEEARRLAEANAEAQLQILIDAALLEQEAKKQEREDPSLQVTQVAIDEAIRQFQLSQGIPDEATFQRLLREQGYTYASFRRQMFRNLRIQGLLTRVLVPRLNVTDEEVVNYMKENPDAFETRAEARNFLREQRFNEEKEKYLASLREKAFIKVFIRF